MADENFSFTDLPLVGGDGLILQNGSATINITTLPNLLRGVRSGTGDQVVALHELGESRTIGETSSLDLQVIQQTEVLDLMQYTLLVIVVGLRTRSELAVGYLFLNLVKVLTYLFVVVRLDSTHVVRLSSAQFGNQFTARSLHVKQ